MLGNPTDLSIEVHGSEGVVGLAYLTSLSDLSDIKLNLLQPLLGLLVESSPTPTRIIDMLPETGPNRCASFETALADLLQGRSVLF